MNKSIKAIVLGATLAVLTGSVLAQDYNLQETADSRNVTVKVEIPKMSGITQPDDIELRFDGSGNIENSKPFCVYSNVGSNVKLQIDGTVGHIPAGQTTTPSGFYMTQNVDPGFISATPGHKELPFQVFYKAAQGGEKEITNGKNGDISGAKWVRECRADTKSGSELIVKVKKEHAEDVFAGTYSSTLTLMVSPE